MDYNGLLNKWDIMRISNDQIAFSSFVCKTMTRWDTLSLKWHCWNLERLENDIWIEECYTHHSKMMARHALFDTGFRLWQSVGDM